MSQAARFRASVLSTNLFKSTTLGVSNYWGWGSGSRLSGGFTVNVFRMVFKGFHRVVLFGREVLEIRVHHAGFCHHGSGYLGFCIRVSLFAIVCNPHGTGWEIAGALNPKP